MSINLKNLKKIVEKPPTPEPVASEGYSSMGSDIGYLIQLLGRSLLGALAWRFISSFAKKSDLSVAINSFWIFFVAIAFCYISDTKLRFLGPYQRDFILGIIGTPFLDWFLKLIR